MRRSSLVFTLSVAAFALAPADFAAAQQASPSPPVDKGYYYGPTTPTPETKNFAQQKARLRAEQRIARLESYRRYGLTPNRPTAEALPFTSAYPLMWLRRNTTPTVTYDNYRPLMYYGYPYTVYR